MGSVTKLENTILGATCVIQSILLLSVDVVIALLVPPLLAAVPYGYAVLGSEQMMRQMTLKRRRRAYVCISVLLALVAASLIFGGDDASPRFRIIQALLADAAILWLAAIVAVSFRSPLPRF